MPQAQSTTTASLLTYSCYACGLQELTLSMRRASSSRRRNHPQEDARVRSRSTERFESDHDLAVDVDSAAVEDDLYQDSEHIAKPIRFHRRSISDPFDAQEDLNSIKGSEEEDSFAANGSLVRDEQYLRAGAVIPTLPRFPVAETRNQNCFSEPPVSIFHVRGSNYFVDKKKDESGPYLMPARGCDFFMTENHKSLDFQDKYVSFHCRQCS